MQKIFRGRHLTPGSVFTHGVLAFGVVFYGIPLLWLLFAAFRTESSLLSGAVFAWPDFAAFAETWTDLTSYNDFQIFGWIKNSLIYAAGGVALAIVTCIPAGYALASSEFPGRRLILVTTLIAMITPSTAVVLPIFLELIVLRLNNTYAGLILASGFFPFGVYLSFIYFTSSLPKGVMDSARVDGCSRWQLFTKMALPLATPVISLVAFFSFLGIWTNYFLAFVLLSDDSLYNLPVGLTSLVSSSGALSNLPSNDLPIRKPEVILAAILTVLPILVIFLAAQRFVRSGMLSGAEKG